MGKFWLARVFYNDDISGNLTGVIQLESEIEKEQGQAIATRLQLPDIAFIWGNQPMQHRTFSPHEELTFCTQTLLASAAVQYGRNTGFARFHYETAVGTASLYKQGFAPYILPSCGYKPHVGTTEWNYLRNIGVDNGVPEEAILKEDKAQHTLENARFSLEVLKQAGIHRNKVIIVCKAGHSRRALLCYQSEFPRETEFLIAPVIDRYGITKGNWFLSEVEKIGKYFGDNIPNWVK